MFHEFNFLSVDAVAPTVDVILMDGHLAGSMLRVGGVDPGAVVEETLMSVPYALLPLQPRVLLLGEVGGGNVWLAQRYGAASIQLIQPDQALLSVFKGPLRDDTGSFLSLPAVDVFTADPRHFVEHTSSQFDLIQLVSMESMTAGSGGIAGLAENYLVTVEGLTASLRALTEEGVLSVCRGIQDPPRDNLKLLTTLIEALRRFGVSHPEDHIVIVRDFLAVCTLVKRTPWSPKQIQAVRDLCSQRDLTPVWFTSIRDNELNYPDELPGPLGAGGDWYHHAARQLFSPDSASAFIDDWMFDIRPTTDSRPFFLDFGKLRSLGAMRKAFGEMWLTRAELAYLFVLSAAGLVATASVLLTIAPLLLLRSIRRSPRKKVTAAYFGAIGLGYLLLEMVVLSALTHLIGDPIHAAALTIATFLLFSGLGSMLSQRRNGQCAADHRAAAPVAIDQAIAAKKGNCRVFRGHRAGLSAAGDGRAVSIDALDRRPHPRGRTNHCHVLVVLGSGEHALAAAPCAIEPNSALVDRCSGHLWDCRSHSDPARCQQLGGRVLIHNAVCSRCATGRTIGASDGLSYAQRSVPPRPRRTGAHSLGLGCQRLRLGARTAFGHRSGHDLELSRHGGHRTPYVCRRSVAALSLASHARCCLPVTCPAPELGRGFMPLLGSNG